MYQTMYTNDRGELKEYAGLSMLGQSGNEWLVPGREMIPLPRGATLAAIPNHIPVGFDISNDCVQAVEYAPDLSGETCHAVGAILPQGFARTLFPACVKSPHVKNVDMPLLGYAAIGYKRGEIYVAAMQIDRHRKWHPAYYNTERLPERIDRALKKHPDNRILRQLARCSLQYNCFTAQNIFYRRWEGGIPTTRKCNARCIACISEEHPAQAAATQQRLDFLPAAQEIAEIGTEHLKYARDGIISFGQGCEGEPSLNGKLLAESIIMIRGNTRRGTININTNAGFTGGIEAMCDAGLDSMRVSIFSCRDRRYKLYHQPQNYGFLDVERSIAYAKSKGVHIALNLLAFPGFTDQEEEAVALVSFCRRNRIDAVQLRNLNIDPSKLLEVFPEPKPGIGMLELVEILREQCPRMKIASYSHPVIR